MTLSGSALGIQREQLGGGVAHLSCGARLGFVPLAAAQLVQRRLLGLRTAVAADHAELRDRDVELVPALVFEDKEFTLPFLEIHLLQTKITTNSMLLMHHGLADLELGEIAQHALDGAALLGAAPASAHHPGVELRLGDYRPSFGWQREAARQGRHAEHELRGLR